MEKIKACLAKALHPGTNEAEALAALLAARRLYAAAGSPGMDKFFTTVGLTQPHHYTNSSETFTSHEYKKRTVFETIRIRKIDSRRVLEIIFGIKRAGAQANIFIRRLDVIDCVEVPGMKTVEIEFENGPTKDLFKTSIRCAIQSFNMASPDFDINKTKRDAEQAAQKTKHSWKAAFMEDEVKRKAEEEGS